MNDSSPLSVIILAAGKGTRMKSAKAKVLHEVFFKPMLHHVLEGIKSLMPERCVVIVGHQEETVRKTLQGYEVEIVQQKEQLGTGHAVQMTEKAIPEDTGEVMILCGDTPLISSDSLQKMYEHHLNAGAELTVMTTILENPTGYGRIISQENSVMMIVEEKEADEQQKKIKEINAGIYMVKRRFLFEALATITPENTQGEYYLTDIVEYAVSKGKKAEKLLNPIPMEVLGVNSRVELEAAHKYLQLKRNMQLMQKGISVYCKDTVTVSLSSELDTDTVLYAGVNVLGKSILGKSCVIENGAILQDCILGDNVTVGANSVLKNCRIESNTAIAPLTCLFS